MKLNLWFFVFALFCRSVFAGPQGLTFQGQLLKDGVIVEDSNVDVTIKITSMPVSGTRPECTLFEESYSLNMTASNGIFLVTLGTGTRTSNDLGLSISNVFANTGTLSSLNCVGAPTATAYTPLATDSRNIYVSFVDGPDTVAFAQPYVIQSVPYAIEAERLSSAASSGFLQTSSDTTQSKVDAIFASTPYAELLALINGTSTSFAGLAGGNLNLGSGRIGVGTTNPSSDLSFGGNVARTIAMERATSSQGNNLTVSAGGATTSSTDQNGGTLNLSSGISTGAGSSAIQFQTSSPASSGTLSNSPSTKMTVLGNGNVGIGTTTPQANLEIQGSTASNLASTSNILQLIRPLNSGVAWPNVATFKLGSYTNGYGPTTELDINLKSTANISATGDYNVMTLLSNGNVGIGTTTPVSTLQVMGTTSAKQFLSTDGYGGRSGLASFVNNSSDGGSVHYYESGSGIGTPYTVTGGMLQYVGSTQTAALKFLNGSTPLVGQIDLSSGGTSVLRVVENGSVGIGTTSPSALLDVYGIGRMAGLGIGTNSMTDGSSLHTLSAYAGNSTVLLEYSGAPTSLVGPSIGLKRTGASKYFLIADDTINNDALSFQLNDGTKIVTITQSGKVGVGTTSPVDDFQINGGITAWRFTSGYGAPNAVNFGNYGNGFYYDANGAAISSNATERIRVLSNGNVGIGTTSPASSLDVNGTISVNGLNAFSLPPDSCTPAGSSIAIGNNALKNQTTGTCGTGSYNIAIGTYAMGSGSPLTGSNNLAIGFKSLTNVNSGGNNACVGNGSCTVLSTANNTTALGLNTAYRVTTGSQNTALGASALQNVTTTNYNTAVGWNSLINTTGSRNTALGASSGSTNVSGSDNILVGNGVGSATLQSGSSNILIGNSVDTPLAATSNYLNIGNVIFATGMNGTLAAPAGNVGIGKINPKLPLDIAGSTLDSNGSEISPAGMLRIESSNGYGNLLDIGAYAAYPNGIWFQAHDRGNFGATYPILLNPKGGNVGIGTLTPSAKLNIVSDAGTDALFIASQYGDAFRVNQYGVSIFNANLVAGYDANISSFAYSAFNDLYITSGYQQSPSKNIIIKPAGNGNVGIATLSPAYTLDVSGDVNIASANVLRFGGNSVCSSSGCTSPSDLRLKNHVEPLEDSLAKILQLQGVSYHWNQESFGAEEQIGLIAQDVEKIYPQAVKTDLRSSYKSIAYDHLIAPVIESIKTIYERITSLDTENKALKERVVQLEEQTAAMMSRMDQLEKLNQKR